LHKQLSLEAQAGQFVQGVHQLNSDLASLPCFYFIPRVTKLKKARHLDDSDLVIHIIFKSPIMLQAQHELTEDITPQIPECLYAS
jgi:hypothetical protein